VGLLVGAGKISGKHIIGTVALVGIDLLPLLVRADCDPDLDPFLANPAQSLLNAALGQISKTGKLFSTGIARAGCVAGVIGDFQQEETLRRREYARRKGVADFTTKFITHRYS
jgi:hypothetical protein